MQETITSQNMPVKRNLPRDVFLHLFAIVALYWSAVSVITLCWQYINYYFPTVLEARYGGQSYLWAIRFAVSSLVILFPLFILVSWYLNKIYRREIAVRESKIRKWLVYLTLFVASLIIAGDFVTVIYNFLGGDVTMRFILKALSIMIVAGFIFGYYLDDIRKSEPSVLSKYFAWLASALVLIAVVGSFFIIGSPMSARLTQLDETRISDLQSIQYQILNYWQTKTALPNDLSDLNDSISGYTAPTDPTTHESYEYTIKDASTLSFQLCATFDLAGSQLGMGSAPMAVPSYGYKDTQSWDHQKGRACFDKQIDKDRYAPLNKG